MDEPAAAPPSALNEAPGWIGHGVDEVGGARVGQVEGLFVDAESGEPTWLVAKLGRLGRSRVAIPLRDCASGGGAVWVAHSRETIRSAPVVDVTRPLRREHELTICVHYGIGERVGRAAEVVGRADGAVTSTPDKP